MHSSRAQGHKRQRAHAHETPPVKRVRATTHNYADAQSPISSARRPGAKAARVLGGGDVVRSLVKEFEDAGDHELGLFSSTTAFHAGEAAPTPTQAIALDNNDDDGGNVACNLSKRGDTPVPVTHTMPVIDDEFDPFYFIKHLPALPPHHRLRPSTLPRKTRRTPKHTLVLDMDETLLHSSLTPVDRYDVLLPVQVNNQVVQVYVSLRPHLDAFLSEVCEVFEVVVFTASQRVYAEKLLNILDPQRKRIKHRQYRESCVEVEGNLLKDLGILGRDLSRTIIIDNSIHAFGYQVDNGIPITSWYDDADDTELLALVPQLKGMSRLSDVRPFIRSTYRLHEHIQNAC